MTTPPHPARRTPLAILDIVAAIVLAFLAALIGLVFLAYLGQLSALSEACEGIAADGARCAPGFLAGLQTVGFAIVIFAWFVTTGFIVVRVLRRRMVFFLPLLGVAIMIAGFYAVVAVASASYLPPA